MVFFYHTPYSLSPAFNIMDCCAAKRTVTRFSVALRITGHYVHQRLDTGRIPFEGIIGVIKKTEVSLKDWQ